MKNANSRPLSYADAWCSICAYPKREIWKIGCDRGKLHFGDQCNEDIRREAAKQLLKDRKAAKELGLTPPGQAEYLDILKALVLLAAAGEDQSEALAAISDFSLKKYPAQYGE